MVCVRVRPEANVYAEAETTKTTFDFVSAVDNDMEQRELQHFIAKTHLHAVLMEQSQPRELFPATDPEEERIGKHEEHEGKD